MATIFTKEMCIRLAELYDDEEDRINPKKHTANANRKANEAWARILDAMNAEFTTTKLSLAQIQVKVKNLKAAAKKKSATDRRLYLYLMICC